MSDTTTVRRYRVTNAVHTSNADWVNLTSVIDARLDLCSNEIQIGTYAIAHFKQMLKDELESALPKHSTKRKMITEVIKEIKRKEKYKGRSDLNIFLTIHREDEYCRSYEDQEVPDEEKNDRFRVNPFDNEVENSIEYDIS
jgi:hypothetical protein